MQLKMALVREPNPPVEATNCSKLPLHFTSNARRYIGTHLRMDNFVDIEKRPWHVAAALTVIMSIATAAGTYASSYFLLPVKMKEEAEKAAVERKAKGTQLHCEKLQLSASLASEIRFCADRGYSNRISDRKLLDEQLALERRAAELTPFLSEQESEILENVTLHHYVITQMRTSKVPVSERVPPSQGGFDANRELDEVRGGADKLAAAYRSRCTESL